MRNKKRWAAYRETMPKPVELRRGGIYVIESEKELTGDLVEDIQAYLAVFQKETGCKFLLLDAGLHIAIVENT